MRREFTQCSILKYELVGQLQLVLMLNFNPDNRLNVSTINRVNRCIEIINEMESHKCEEYLAQKEVYATLKEELSNVPNSKLSNEILEMFLTETKPKETFLAKFRRDNKGFIAE